MRGLGCSSVWDLWASRVFDHTGWAVKSHFMFCIFSPATSVVQKNVSTLWSSRNVKVDEQMTWILVFGQTFPLNTVLFSAYFIFFCFNTLIIFRDVDVFHICFALEFKLLEIVFFCVFLILKCCFLAVSPVFFWVSNIKTLSETYCVDICTETNGASSLTHSD